MPEFIQSWAFAFLIIAISFAAGFVLAIIIAGSGRASRMEERISDNAIHRLQREGKQEEVNLKQR